MELSGFIGNISFRMKLNPIIIPQNNISLSMEIPQISTKWSCFAGLSWIGSSDISMNLWKFWGTFWGDSEMLTPH